MRVGVRVEGEADSSANDDTGGCEDAEDASGVPGGSESDECC